MYARRYGDRELTFDFAAGLLHDNLLFVDRETKTIWSQLEGKAVSGELEGEALRMVPSLQTTWKHWKELHPGTRVMVSDEEGRPYLYRNYKPGDPRPEEPPTAHDMSRLGLGVALGQDATFFPLHALAETDLPLRIEMDGSAVRIFYSEEGLTAWAEDAEGRLLPAVLAYDFGWMSFFPDSEVYSPDAE